MQDKHCRVLRKLRNWCKEMSLNNKYTVSSCVINWCPKDKGCLVFDTKTIYAAWSLNWPVRVLLKSTHIFIFMISTAQDIISGTQYISKCCTLLSTRVEITPKTGAVRVQLWLWGMLRHSFIMHNIFQQQRLKKTHTHAQTHNDVGKYDTLGC